MLDALAAPLVLIQAADIRALRRGERDEDGADGVHAVVPRAGKARDADGEIRAEARAALFRHLDGGLMADGAVLTQALGVDAEELHLHLVRIDDDAAEKDAGGAGRVRHQVAHEAAGAALGHGDRLAALDEAVHGVGLDIIAVNAVGKDAELVAHALDPRGDHGLGLGLRAGLRRDAHEALPFLGVRREGGVRHLIHQIAQLILHRALADAEDAHVVREDEAVRARLEQRADAVLEHRAALERRAGQHDDQAAVRLEGAAGGGAPVVDEDGAALRQHDLLEVVFGHVGVALFVEPAQARFLLLVQDELFAEGGGDGLLREIIARGAEAARGDDHVRPLLGAADDLLETAGIVAHDGLPEDVDAELREQARDVRGVGVDRLAEQQLGADRDDFSIHIRS